ncbi:MAG TPA: MFS transporter, partial [Elusimicrobiota bacterium]|nr:MFS transporter [Elusimicrobiota bacterium]
GGLVLHHFGRLNWHGFVWILVAAGCLRLMSLKFLRQMHEPAEIAQEAPSYRACLMRHPHYSRFIMTYGLMAICVSLTSPFLSLFMLRDLGWSYAQYTLMIVAAQATLYWMMGRWGRNADSAGNMKIIQITARFLPLTALLWIFSRNFYYLMGVQLVSGAVWAGYNLCVGNYVYDAVPNRQRVHATALFSTVNGLATFVGATLGGFLLNLLPPLGGERYYSLLLAGGLARMLVGWLLFPRLREVREVAPTRSKELVCDVLGIDSLRDAVPFEI